MPNLTADQSYSFIAEGRTQINLTIDGGMASVSTRRADGSATQRKYYASETVTGIYPGDSVTIAAESGTIGYTVTNLSAVYAIDSGGNVTGLAGPNGEAVSIGGALQTVTVTSAQQDIDFTGLDLDVDVQYRIELVVAPNAVETQTAFVYYNGDLTAANYQNQLLFGSASTASASRNSTAAALLGGGGTSSTDYAVSATATISKLPGKRPTLHSISAYDAGGMVATIYTHRWTGTANITAIKLRHTTLFGVGTVARLYRG